MLLSHSQSQLLLRHVILQGFPFYVLLKRKQGIKRVHVWTDSWSIRCSSAAWATAGGSVSVLLNPCTVLAKQDSSCIFPGYRSPFSLPPWFLQHFGVSNPRPCRPAQGTAQVPLPASWWPPICAFLLPLPYRFYQTSIYHCCENHKLVTGHITLLIYSFL